MFIIIFLVLLFIVWNAYMLIPPKQDFVYTDLKGNAIKVICVLTNKIVIQSVQIKENKELEYLSNPEAISWFQFKITYLIWIKL